MSTSLERFKKRQKKKQTITVTESNTEIEAIADKFLNSNLNESRVNETLISIQEHYSMDISAEEIEIFLIKFEREFNDKMFNQLVNNCKKDVINSIVAPFGLGKIVAAYDKTGGNVDTIHNVRNVAKTGLGMSDEEQVQNGIGIYSTDKAKEQYESRGQYDSDKYHKDKNFIDINRTQSAQKKDGKAVDYISGEKIDRNGKADLDHIVSAKEIHDDAGRVLANIDGTELANTNENLKLTDSSINRSKKADTMEEFIDRKNENIKKINTLKSKDNLTQKEQHELAKLEKLQKVDDKRALKEDSEARDKQNKKINKEYYTSESFIKNNISTGAVEGAKMGTQQALGLIITEFFTAVFDEIIDIYKNGFSNGFDNDKFFTILKERLKKISIRVSEKWRDVAIAFKDGFISGFISNLVTTVINMFVTTGKRVIRIIREGIFSLFRAVRLLLFPPENMTYEEAMHEAKKLLATGLIVSLGVIAEEYIDLLIKGTTVLEPFADILTSVFVGAITGLSITMVVYYIDKKRNDKNLFNHLVEDTNKKYEEFNTILANAR